MRPTKYKEEYCQELLEFFNRPLYMTRTVQQATASGRTASFDQLEACDLPSFAGFARKIAVCEDTLYEWKKVHPAFSESFTKAKAIQKEIILMHAMKNNYNAGFAKFMLINCHGMKDKIEQENVNRNIEVNVDTDDDKL